MELKIVHFSDTHSLEEVVDLPECDLAIFSGDLTDVGSKQQVEKFLKWFKYQTQCTEKVFIAGNHDRCFHDKYNKDTKANEWLPDLLEDYCLNTGLHYLENSGIDLLGLKIWGSPITPWFHGHFWAFNKHRGEEIRQIWQNIPKDTDILITHGPVAYKLDYVPATHEYVGCEDLRYMVKMIKPKLLCHGHTHHDGGSMDEDEDTIYSNGSIMTESYKPINKPNIIYIQI